MGEGPLLSEEIQDLKLSTNEFLVTVFIRWMNDLLFYTPVNKIYVKSSPSVVFSQNNFPAGT